MAVQDDEKGIIAHFSLSNLPPEIMAIYASIKEADFWDCWDEMGIPGYTDIVAERDNIPMEEKPIIPFPECVRDALNDKLIQWWDGENLSLSDYLKEEISSWKERLQEMDDIAEEDVEEYLANTIIEAVDVLGCRDVDKAFADEIMGFKDDINHRKSLALFRQLMEDDADRFPELTKTQAIKWVVSNYVSREDKDVIMAFHSLMTNIEQRQRVLGF